MPEAYFCAGIATMTSVPRATPSSPQSTVTEPTGALGIGESAGESAVKSKLKSPLIGSTPFDLTTIVLMLSGSASVLKDNLR